MKLLMRFFDEKAKVNLKILWLGIILSTIFLSQNIITFKDGYLYSSSKNNFYAYAENLQDESIQILKLEKMLKEYRKDDEVHEKGFTKREIIDEVFKLNNKEEIELYMQELEKIEEEKKEQQKEAELRAMVTMTMLIGTLVFSLLFLALLIGN